MRNDKNVNELYTILIVDDSSDNILMLSSLLKDSYRTKIATNGQKAIQIAQGPPMPDLILLDVVMPSMDGYEVCRRLKEDPMTADIPIIFLTARADVESEQLGLTLGAVDYITKPVSPPIVLARVETHLVLKAARDFLKDKNAYLESEVKKRTKEVQLVQDVTIMAMASLAETRDHETGNHIRRTQNYVRRLAIQLKSNPRFSWYLTDENIEILYKSAPLHDIGKVGIPDKILLKPGRLTPEEFEIMKKHPALGRDAIINAERLIDDSSSFLLVAKEIAYSHQEKWDGTGYPEGLTGDDIPISARLMALADVYDALINRRVYKPAFSHEKSADIIKKGKASHFDPDVVDAFFAVEEDFKEIARNYPDNDLEFFPKEI